MSDDTALIRRPRSLHSNILPATGLQPKRTYRVWAILRIRLNQPVSSPDSLDSRHVDGEASQNCPLRTIEARPSLGTRRALLWGLRHYHMMYNMYMGELPSEGGAPPCTLLLHNLAGPTVNQLVYSTDTC